MEDQPDKDEQPPVADQAWKKPALVTAIVAVALLGLFLAIRMRGVPPNSAALYIGVPTLLSLGLAVVARSKSVVGAIFKGLTIALLMSTVLLGAGSICILMSAPLFYLVGGFVGNAVDKRKAAVAAGKKDGSTLLSAATATVLALVALEGTHPALSFNRLHTVSVTRTIPASAAAVEAWLSAAPRFDDEMPLFFRLGFPEPLRAVGSGLDIGDRREVYLRDGSLYLRAGKRVDGAVIFEVAEREPGRVRFVPLRDDSPVAKWLDWTTSEVRWVARPDGATDVTWTLGFRRKLDPVWYFGPMQRYAVSLTAGVLIDSLATPDG